MRRRLDSPAPAGPAAAPPAPQQPLTAELVPQPQAAGQTTALAFPADIMAMGDFEREASLLPMGKGPGAPYVQFYSGRGKSVGDVFRDLGQVATGTPLLRFDGHYYGIAGSSYFVLQQLPYWATVDQSYDETRVWLDPQPFGKVIGSGAKAEKVKECIMALLIVLPGAGALPEDIQPAVASLSTFRGGQVAAIKGHLDRVEETKDPKWAKEGGNGPIAASFGPRFRIASSFKPEAKPGSDGNPYVKVSAISQTVSIAQLQAFHAFSTEPECVAQLQEVMDAFNRRKDYLVELAGETQASGGQ